MDKSQKKTTTEETEKCHLFKVEECQKDANSDPNFYTENSQHKQKFSTSSNNNFSGSKTENELPNSSAFDKFTNELNKTIQLRQTKNFDLDQETSKCRDLTTTYLKDNYSEKLQSYNQAWSSFPNQSNTVNFGANLSALYQEEILH